MACAASPTALSPDPQTLLIVRAATSRRQSATERGLPGRILSESRSHDIAHNCLVDLLGRHPGPFDGLPDYEGA